MHGKLFHTFVALGVLLSFFFPAPSAANDPTGGTLSPGKKDLCPVCGMFVHKYPNWVAQVVFRDGTHVFFDGPKDMFKYIVEMKKYNPKKNREDIAEVWVTDYYTAGPIDGRRAYYVAGSDVLGPMGHELIPHGSEKAAVAFMKDHGGKRWLRFEEIDRPLLESIR